MTSSAQEIGSTWILDFLSWHTYRSRDIESFTSAISLIFSFPGFYFLFIIGLLSPIILGKLCEGSFIKTRTKITFTLQSFCCCSDRRGETVFRELDPSTVDGLVALICRAHRLVNSEIERHREVQQILLIVSFLRWAFQQHRNLGIWAWRRSTAESKVFKMDHVLTRISIWELYEWWIWTVTLFISKCNAEFSISITRFILRMS